jgi:hypothetical protein
MAVGVAIRRAAAHDRHPMRPRVPGAAAGAFRLDKLVA